MADVTWKPTNRQEEFLSLPDTIFEALYGGAAAGGKSECLIMLPIVRGFYKHSRFKGIIFRRTYKELEDEIIVRSQKWYPLVGGRYNVANKRWTFPSGAIMTFGHSEYESDVRKYDSAEYNYMAFDELTSFTENQYTYLSMTRCRTSSDLPAIVRSATNPGNVGHQWVRERFIEKIPYGSVGIDAVTKQKRIFIQSKVSDNPHIDPGYADRLLGLSEAERRAKLDGDWYTFEGQAFGEYREFPNVGEPENAQHVIKPFEIPVWWPRLLAIDWGYSAMTCALWGAISPDKRLYIYREYVVNKTKIADWATEVGKLSIKETLVDVILCASAWQNRGDESTVVEQFTKYSGLIPRTADNSRIAGKLMVQEYLRWEQRPEARIVADPSTYDASLAAHILRVNGTEEYKKYLDSFNPSKGEDNLPKLQIFETISSIRKVIPLCVYDKQANVSGKPAEDIKEFKGDDPYDTLRYLIMGADRHLNSAVVAGEYEKKVHQVYSEFTRNQDYTALHRKMEMLERTKPKQVPVRRRNASRFVR
jgi:hypothetical protein